MVRWVLEIEAVTIGEKFKRLFKVLEEDTPTFMEDRDVSISEMVFKF